MASKKVLITGADGFIGSHLTETLVRAGYDVRAFVLYNSFGSWGWLDESPEDVRSAVEIFLGDIRDPNGVRRAIDGCDVVLNLAALIGIPFSYHSPDAYVDTNIKGLLNVLQAARDLEVERIVHTSTSEVYGTALSVPITEDHPLQGQSPYSATKIGADQIALSFYRSFDLPVGILRPFNTYGPRQSARAVIPTVITQLLDGNRQIQIGYLHPTRDFTFVSDTVDAFRKAIEVDRDAGFFGSVVNVGSGFEVSIKETCELIGEVVGTDIELVSDSQRMRPEKSEVERLWADNTRAREVLGWTPAHGGIDGFRQGMEKTIEWFKVPENRQSYKGNIYNI